ncbi:MAG: class 3 adenylate cyclase [Saprospiraceae bacterium]|jgi:class 3 adenylate cyclase
MSDWVIRRTRLLNGICFFAAIIFFGFSIAYVDMTFSAIFYESIVAVVLYMLTIFINKLGLYNIARTFFILFNALLFSYFAVAHGEADGAEYLLFCSSVASMLFFERFSTISFFFLFNVAAFWVAKYLFDHVTPFAASAGANLYIENHVFTFLGLFMIVYFFKSENQRKEHQLVDKNEILTQEMNKSEKLLLNILPEDVAEEMKENGMIKPRHFDQVCVLFTDFKSFTQISESMTPEDLVNELDNYFTAFDKIISNYGIEKIKTIGDSYMCAYGLNKSEFKPEKIIQASIELQQHIVDVRKKNIRDNKPFFEMRVGIHVGAVVAGIVGKKKFAYDIWGDTVNIASRLESACEVGKINISENLYLLVKDHFQCQPRGNIMMRNRGVLSMYFVNVA